MFQLSFFVVWFLFGFLCASPFICRRPAIGTSLHLSLKFVSTDSACDHLVFSPLPFCAVADMGTLCAAWWGTQPREGTEATEATEPHAAAVDDGDHSAAYYTDPARNAGGSVAGRSQAEVVSSRVNKPLPHRPSPYHLTTQRPP